MDMTYYNLHFMCVTVSTVGLPPGSFLTYGLKNPLVKKKNPLCFPSVASQKLVLNLTKLGNQTSYEFRGREILNQGRVKKPSNSIIFPFHTNTNFSNQREIV